MACKPVASCATLEQGDVRYARFDYADLPMSEERMP
jgi:hypothetical protein